MGGRLLEVQNPLTPTPATFPTLGREARFTRTAFERQSRRDHLQTSKLVGLFTEYCVHVVVAGQALAGLIEKDLQIG